MLTAQVTALGTPSMVRATSGSVTASWGTGQNRNAGDLLVALVSAGGSTASAAAISTPSGWTQQAVIGNTTSSANAWVTVYTKVAAGSDSAPAFTATLSGTAAMTVTLLELVAANCISIADTSGTYSSGASAGTLSAMTATTAANVTQAGEYAVTVFTQEAAAATNTWNAGSGWSNLASDGATSSVLHTAVDWQANPTSGATLAETAHWTTDTTAFGAGIIVVFNAYGGGVELFTDQASTTITSGGTDAPAAGTPEFWTAASWSTFPVASNTATPPTHFTIADTASGAFTELIRVLNTSTGLVIRGAEGTTPVAHTGGFTVQNVTGAGTLGSFTQWYNVRSTLYGATGNGSTDDTAAIQAAITACSNAGGGVVYLPAGTYKVSNITIGNLQCLYGDGVATILKGASGSTGYVLALTAPASDMQVQIRNLQVEPATGQGGVQLDNTGFTGYPDASHLLEDVWVISAGNDGFHFDNVVREIRVTRCHVYGAGGYGFYIGADCTDSRFTDCTSATTTGHGFGVLGSNVSFVGCKAFYAGYLGSSAWNTTSNGWNLSSADQCRLVACEGQQNALHGINLTSSINCVIAGCDSDTNNAGGSAGGCGININASTNCAITGNAGGNNTGLGTGTQVYGIQVSGTNTGTDIIGNTVFGSSGTFNYVSGGGYFRIDANEIDISQITEQKVGSLFLAPSSVQAVSNGSTITWENFYGSYWLSATGAVTGLLMPGPKIGGTPVTQNVTVTLVNTSAYPMTFAASGTSYVADGTADVIAAGQAATYIWDGTNSLWRRTQSSLQLDTTASDIAAAGAQAAGSTGQAADAGHVHPAVTGGYSRMGTVVGWTCPPLLAQASDQLPTAGVLFMWQIEIPVAGTTSNFNMFVTAAGNTLANVYAALVNTSGTIVASTANRASDTALVSAGALWSPPWSSAYSAPAGEYYGCLLIGSATTMPTFISGTNRAAALTNIGCSAAAGNLRVATTGSGLSSLPGSPITMSGISSNQNPMWAALT